MTEKSGRSYTTSHRRNHSMTMPLPPCSVLLLAGGRGQRMGGHDKGLLEWRGKPLIAHLHAVTRPITSDLIISCNRNTERYALYADHVVHDDRPDFPGPLAGIRAGLAVARHGWLLILPCDAPLVDAALLYSMRQHASAHPERPLLLRQGQQWEPLFCLIPKSLEPALERAWQDGERSPRRVFLAHEATVLQCASGDSRLANLNTPRLLEQFPT
ncbi:molybdopterin-guanine dinucleotide biosynthesis protein MobA [Azotobacter vinelandii CA]|uniref:Molybdenum cofactor guanylyltransferase n=3 Tax=Azotobacter group TaxID=351 RepID=C1DQV4_AZOVD|nr:molybdopterin-guanine dinucleotide biosynthesis protein A [Azotobacter vinelandii DJ]AGK12926.1 molybdopterin-guanine dinucleotide biosynthesis protein MobA [Azotobacter vinelandii CA]AGK18302.1 molybdopterin-guanine dinucleotide biosynthesis protein MobA [Azotobacter vinelandii CA6]